MSIEEAEKHPAGAGRNEPDPLEKPKYVSCLGWECDLIII